MKIQEFKQYKSLNKTLSYILFKKSSESIYRDYRRISPSRDPFGPKAKDYPLQAGAFGES